MPYFGVHESISLGFDAAVRKVASVGFDCVQIFSANASRWQNKPIDPKAAERFQTALKEYMRRKDRDLNKLIKYAEVLKMREEVINKVIDGFNKLNEKVQNSYDNFN